MILKFGFFRRFLFGLSIPGMESFWQDFPGTENETRRQLRRSSNAFLSAYNTALEIGLSDLLFQELDAYDVSFRGFAYEGAGMGMAMLDYVTPGNQNRLQQYVASAPKYKHLAHIGAGFAIAVLKRNLNQSLSKMPPMERWWAIDGYGFYNGIFNWRKTIEQQAVPKQIEGYAQQAFDRGVGRSMWFVLNGDVDNVAKKMASFDISRRANLWGGIGVASSYAGGVNKETLLQLKAVAGDYTSYLAQGTALSAHARYLANNIVEHNDLACSVHWGMSAEKTAKLTFGIEDQLIVDEQEAVFCSKPVFDIYLEQIRTQFIQVPILG